MFTWIVSVLVALRFPVEQSSWTPEETPQTYSAIVSVENANIRVSFNCCVEQENLDQLNGWKTHNW